MRLFSKKKIMAFGLTTILLILAVSLQSSYYTNSSINYSHQVKFLIGMSQANLAEDWQSELKRDIDLEALKHDDIRVVYTDATQSSRKQVQDIGNLLELGVDLLIISLNDVNDIKPAISEAYKRIPVIIIDGEITGSDYTLLIGADNKKAGFEAGKYLLDSLGTMGGDVVEIVGQDSSPISIERSEGFRDALSKNKNIKVVNTLVGDWMRDKTEDLMKMYFDENPKIQAVFAHNDEMALGAYTAAKKLRIEGIKFVGVGGSYRLEGGVELVKEGILDCSISYPTGGKEAIQYALKILNKEKNLPKRVVLNSQILRKDDMSK